MNIHNRLAALLIGSMSWTVAVADMRDFTLANNTPWPIYNVYISEPDALYWGADVLGAGTLGSGRYTDVTFTGGNSCVNDIRIRFSGSADMRWSNVNFCRVSKMTIWYNYSSRAYQAQWD